MRWVVDVTSLGKGEKESLFVEAESWQKALQSARGQRGETAPMSGFSIELLDDGCRAVDPTSRLRYEVRKAAEDAVASAKSQPPRPVATQAKRPAAVTRTLIGAGPSSTPPPSAASPAPTSAVAATTVSAAPASVPPRPAASPAPAKAGAAASVPSQIIFKREQDATETLPLAYREYVHLVAPGTSEAAAETLLLTQLAIVRTSIERLAPGKLVHLGAFDVAFTGKSPVPALATVTWKDWRSDPVVSFPRRPKPAVVLDPRPEPPPPPSVAPAPAPAAAPVPAPVVSPTPIVAAAPAVVAPVALAPIAPAPVPRPASVPPPAAAPAVFPPAPIAPPPAPTPAMPPVALAAPVIASPFAPAPVAPPPASAAPPPVVPAAPAAEPAAPAAPVAPAPTVIVAPDPPRAPVPVDRVLVAEPLVFPPAPAAPTTARPRVRGEDLIADLFEAMHDLHFVRDALEGGEFCLALAMEKLPCQAGLVHLYDIDRREFLVASTRGAGTSRLLLRRYPETDAMLLGAMRKRRALVVADAAASDAAGIARYTDLGGARSLLVAPVALHGRFLGALELINPLDGQPFNDSEGNALTYIAEQFAEFIASHGIVTDPDRINQRRLPDA